MNAASDATTAYRGAVTKQPRKERRVLALFGALLILGGFGIAALMGVVSIVMTVQGEPVDWPGIAALVGGGAVLGLLGVWIVRRSGVRIGDAINL